MALKLQHYADILIQKIGRWSSTTWLQYIHTQIAHLPKGVASKMSEDLPFYNIAFIEAPSSTSSTTWLPPVYISPHLLSSAVPQFLSLHVIPWARVSSLWVQSQQGTIISASWVLTSGPTIDVPPAHQRQWVDQIKSWLDFDLGIHVETNLNSRLSMFFPTLSLYFYTSPSC